MMCFSILIFSEHLDNLNGFKEIRHFYLINTQLLKNTYDLIISIMYNV